MEEIWKPVMNWQGVYEVSNLGRIASLKSGKRTILSNVNKKGGYLCVVLGDYRNNSRGESKKLHRLVYETFVGPIPAGFQVHHIDGNKQNNAVSNLMILSPREHHDITSKEYPLYYLPMVLHNKNKPVEQYDLEGNFIAEYMNCKEASRITGVCHRNIVQVAYRTPYKEGMYRKQAGGYIWRLKQCG